MLGFILIGGNSIGLCFYKHNRLWRLKAWSRRGGQKVTPDIRGMRGTWCWASPKLSSTLLSCLLPIGQLNNRRISFSHSFATEGSPWAHFWWRRRRHWQFWGGYFAFCLKGWELSFDPHTCMWSWIEDKILQPRSKTTKTTPWVWLRRKMYCLGT